MAGLSWANRQPIWLLDYDIGGRVLRYATQRVDVTSVDGDVFAYEPGLSDIETGAVYDLGRRTERVELVTDDDWALYVARGIDLDERDAIVRLHFEGNDLEVATEVSTGRTESIAHREIGEPFRMEIVTDSEKDAIWLPAIQAVATDQTWPVRAGYELTKGADGTPYPIPIGYPGDHPKASPGVSLAEPACPALWVERDSATTTDERWVISMGNIDAAQATLWYLTAEDLQSVDLATATMNDELGQLVTYVQTSSLANDDQKWWCGFRNAAGYGGGLKSPYTGNVLRTADEVVRYMLDYFGGGIEIDEARFSGVDGWLSRFMIDGCIRQRTNPVQWINDEILPLLPVVGVQGENGYYLAPMRWDATIEDAVAYLSVDRGQVALDGDLVHWSEPVENLLTLDYRFSPATGGSASQRTLSSVDGSVYEALTTGANLPPFSTSLPWIATSENDTRVYGSALCRWSQTKYGVREWSRLTEYIWDDATAALILQYKALRNCWRKRLGRYVGGMELRSLGPGDVVVLNHAAMHLQDVVCLVSNRVISSTDVALDLILLEHPLQKSRVTV